MQRCRHHHTSSSTWTKLSGNCSEEPVTFSFLIICIYGDVLAVGLVVRSRALASALVISHGNAGAGSGSGVDVDVDLAAGVAVGRGAGAGGDGRGIDLVAGVAVVGRDSGSEIDLFGDGVVGAGSGDELAALSPGMAAGIGGGVDLVAGVAASVSRGAGTGAGGGVDLVARAFYDASRHGHGSSDGAVNIAWSRVDDHIVAGVSGAGAGDIALEVRYLGHGAGNGLSKLPGIVVVVVADWLSATMLGLVLVRETSLPWKSATSGMALAMISASPMGL
uniref:Uncharacterized protein n=1 Tax=Oryza punctata TaxID=4537 RepID=A0A0E0K1Z9_ORYPU